MNCLKLHLQAEDIGKQRSVQIHVLFPFLYGYRQILTDCKLFKINA